jgi:glycosyltransferase involved in cell wall biosynthesis
VQEEKLMSELVSILIPAYNAEKWIGDTIKSALNQTWPSTEIIIVDDGSKDNTLAIARLFESSSVKVITQENRGASAARNRALALAQGNYIQWLDADDLLAPDKISQQLNGAEIGKDTRILLTSAWGRFFYYPQNAKFVPNSLWRDMQPVDWIITRFNESVWMHPASWLITRRLTEMAGPWNEMLSFDDDGEYFCRIVSDSEKVKFVPMAKCYYRVGNSASLSSKRSAQALESLILSIRLCFKHLHSLENSERTKAACLRYLQNRIMDFYPGQPEVIQKVNQLAQEFNTNIVAPKVSLKFSLIKKLFGLKTASKMKSFVWGAEVITRKNLDRLMYIVSK